MKNILIFICSLMAFGCSYDVYSDGVFSSKAGGHQLFYSDEFHFIENEGDAIYYLWKNYSYEKESGDEWKEPSKMFKDRAGDCEDYCLLFVNILYTRLNIKSSILVVNMDEEILKTIVDGGMVNHVIVAVGTSLYDPTFGRYVGEIENFRYKIGYSYSFEEIFIEIYSILPQQYPL